MLRSWGFWRCHTVDTNTSAVVIDTGSITTDTSAETWFVTYTTFTNTNVHSVADTGSSFKAIMTNA
jgi:hypothetical protein